MLKLRKKIKIDLFFLSLFKKLFHCPTLCPEKKILPLLSRNSRVVADPTNGWKDCCCSVPQSQGSNIFIWNVRAYYTPRYRVLGSLEKEKLIEIIIYVVIAATPYSVLPVMYPTTIYVDFSNQTQRETWTKYICMKYILIPPSPIGLLRPQTPNTFVLESHIFFFGRVERGRAKSIDHKTRDFQTCEGNLCIQR